MRTTINIDEHVLAAAKDAARETGLTLGEYIERAVQRERTAALDVRDDPQLRVHHGRLLPGIDTMSNAELLDLLDRDLPLHKRR